MHPFHRSPNTIRDGRGAWRMLHSDPYA
jgi:hypothetical protein